MPCCRPLIYPFTLAGEFLPALLSQISAFIPHDHDRDRDCSALWQLTFLTTAQHTLCLPLISGHISSSPSHSLFTMGVLPDHASTLHSSHLPRASPSLPWRASPGLPRLRSAKATLLSSPESVRAVTSQHFLRGAQDATAQLSLSPPTQRPWPSAGTATPLGAKAEGSAAFRCPPRLPSPSPHPSNPSPELPLPPKCLSAAVLLSSGPHFLSPDPFSTDWPERLL